MAKHFYPDNIKFPKMELALVQRVLIYIAQVLYEEEYNADPQAALARLVLSDVDAGEDVMVGDSVEKFKTTSGKFPFTAYAFNESTERSDMLSQTAKGGIFFCPEADNYIRSFPMELEIPMFSFFTTGQDYFQARSLLHRENVGLTRLRVPIIINGVDTSFPIDISYDISKGSYASSFEEYLRVNRIWNIRHDVTVLFHDFMIDSDMITLVDNMVMTLASQDDEGQPVNGETPTIPELPVVIAASPTDGEQNVSVSSNIEIHFSKPMNESSVFVSVHPFISTDKEWNANSTILTLKPISPLSNLTTYQFVLGSSASDGFGLHLTEDFIFSFTTE